MNKILIFLLSILVYSPLMSQTTLSLGLGTMESHIKVLQSTFQYPNNKAIADNGNRHSISVDVPYKKVELMAILNTYEMPGWMVMDNGAFGIAPRRIYHLSAGLGYPILSKYPRLFLTPYVTLGLQASTSGGYMMNGLGGMMGNVVVEDMQVSYNAPGQLALGSGIKCGGYILKRLQMGISAYYTYIANPVITTEANYHYNDNPDVSYHYKSTDSGTGLMITYFIGYRLGSF